MLYNMRIQSKPRHSIRKPEKQYHDLVLVIRVIRVWFTSLEILHCFICGHSIPGIPYFPFNRFNLDTIRSVIVPFLAFLTQGKSSEDIMPFSMTIM